MSRSSQLKLRSANKWTKPTNSKQNVHPNARIVCNSIAATLQSMDENTASTLGLSVIALLLYSKALTQICSGHTNMSYRIHKRLFHSTWFIRLKSRLTPFKIAHPVPVETDQALHPNCCVHRCNNITASVSLHSHNQLL